MKFRLRMKNNLNLVLSIAFIGILAAYIAVNKEDFQPLFGIDLFLVIPIFFGYVLTAVSNGLFLKVILTPYKKHISLNEATFVSVFSSIGNYIAPVGTGFGMRAVYLKKKHGLPYSTFLSTLAGNYLIVFLVNSALGIISLAALYRYADSAQYKTILFAFGALFITSLLIISFSIPTKILAKGEKIKIADRLFKNFRAVINGWSEISRNKKLILRLIALTFLNVLLSMFITFSIIKSLHLSIGLFELILFSVIGSLSLFINITPGNIGIKEALYIFSAAIVGLTVHEIILIAVIDRAMLLLSLALLWVVLPKTYRSMISYTK